MSLWLDDVNAWTGLGSNAMLREPGDSVDWIKRISLVSPFIFNRMLNSIFLIQEHNVII